MSLLDRLPLRRRSGVVLPDWARADLGRGEKVLAAAPLGFDTDAIARVPDNGWVAATSEGLLQWAEPVDGRGSLVRRRWFQVDRATWDEDGRELDVELVDPSPLLSLRLATDETALPRLVRERVEASIVATHRVTVAGRRGVRLVVRRGGDAGVDGGMIVQQLPDPGVSLDDPAVGGLVADGVRQVREQVGL